ncbi:MAG: hypothetical protein EOO06_00720 [Chitinophagaceae bacterium]|nr:MAG: hypothetical protein EOO06_00720 [Chitinophagaceae bacterium]
MPIYPGGKVKPSNSGGSTSEDPRFTEFTEEAPKREVFVQDNNGQWVGTGMLMLSDNTLLAPEGFGAESGSVKFGDLINLSEASGYLAIYNYLEQSQYQMVDYHVPKDGPSSKPTYVWLYESQNEFTAQPVETTQLNANPLVFSYTTQLQSRVNGIKFKAYSTMTNVRLKITDTSSNVVVKYYPSKSSWEGDRNGATFSVGENLVDFSDSPLLFSPNTTLQYEITADAVSLSGNASGIPYIAGMLQRGEIITLADQKDIQTLQQNSFSGDYNALSNKPVIPTSTSQLTNNSGYVTSSQASTLAPVQSVNGQIGNVTIAIPAGQVNSDWNATSGVGQILNKPTLFSGAYADLSGKPVLFSGNYADLTNKPVLFDGTYASLTGKPTTFTPSAHTHVIGDVSGLQSALDGKISSGASIPYATLTGVPTIPSNTNQLTNGSGYVTAAQAATAAPVQNVNGQTGAVTLTIPAAQIQSDWNQTVTTALDYIKNKPTIPSVTVTSVNSKTGAVVLSATDVGAIATGSSIPYSTLTGVPAIPAAQVQTDWNAVSGLGMLLNKPATFTPSSHTQAWSTITATPTTLAGYGITDAITSASLPNYRRVDNSVVTAPIKVKYYTATSDANSVWTVSLGTDFTEVLDVQVQPVSVANTIAGVRSASLNAYTSTSTSVSGVTYGNNALTTVLVGVGANTLALASSTVVRVRVEGK